MEVRDEVTKTIEKEYVKWRLNFSPMTMEEGREALKFNLYGDAHEFIAEYMIRYGYELGLSQDEINASEDWNNVEITDDMVEMYIDRQETEKEVTPQQIREKLSEIKKDIDSIITKRGAPKKNLRLHCAIAFFMETGKYAPRSETYRIIYKCLDYLGMIDDTLKATWAKTNSSNPETSYVKSLCKEASKYKVFYMESTSLPF